ncbi:MAG TPA: hypothetical protein VGG24_08390 [Paraburkholderia sp.]|jgi:hypothetical protein
MREPDRLSADSPATGVADETYRRERPAVAWGAVVAGALAMAAFSLILLTLGTGLGLSSLSPWPGSGAHAKTFGFAAVIWILVTQIMSAGLGGYLAGRLRHPWPGVSTDEAHFRDTVHGFLAWSLATLVAAAFLTTAVSSVVRAGAGAAAATASAETGASGMANGGTPDRGHALAAYGIWPMGYLIDGMLRPGLGAPAPAAAQGTVPPALIAAQKLEITRIFLNSLPAGGALSTDDSNYVAGIVAQRTGISPADARARVAATWASLQDKVHAMRDTARIAADQARRATIHVTLWLFVSLLVGAFTASLLATIGGRSREW